jgi:phosphatidylinositol glycan class B
MIVLIKTVKNPAFIIFVIYLITAIFSSGYHHPDEHFQLIEFAGLEGGWNTSADLPWEYDAQIRPALQPMLALTWAGLMLMISVAGLYQACLRTRLFYIAVGVLWGLSFEFRYQMAAALFGLLLWLIFVRKEKYKHLLYILSGSLGVVLFCTLLDSWYYGNWVFAPWNYFKFNIVEDVASHFGTSPGYFYLDAILNRPTQLIGFMILFSFLLFLFFDYRNIIVWCLLPFLLVHSLIPHKELRFLFPIVNFVPFILMLAYRKIRSLWNKPVAKAILYPILGIVFLINTGGLVMMTFKPAQYGKINMVKYIHEQYGSREINLYTIAYSNPYSEGPYKGLFARFYANDQVRLKNLSDVLRSQSSTKLNDGDRVILMTGYHERSYLEQQGFVVEKKSIPSWIEKMNRFYQVYEEPFTLVLYSKPDDKKN